MQTSPIAYELPDPSARRRRKRAVLRGGLLGIALIAAAIVWLNRRELLNAAQARWRLYQIYHHTPPPTQVVYDEDPRRVPGLLASGEFVAIPLANGKVAAGRRVPSYAIPASSDPLVDTPSAMLYLHQRDAGLAGRHLVQIFFGRVGDLSQRDGSTPSVFVMTLPPEMKPGDKRSFEYLSRESLGLPMEGPSDFRLFAGQPDLRDMSRFQVAFSANGQPGVVRFHLLTNQEGAMSLEFSVIFQGRISPDRVMGWDSHHFLVPIDDN